MGIKQFDEYSDMYQPSPAIPKVKPPVKPTTTAPKAPSSGGGTASTSNVRYSTNTPVQAKSADELAALYGIKNKEADYAAVLGAATEAKFGMWDTQTKGIRDQQLTDYASQFNQYQNYQRQGRQNALRSGLNRGSAVAQEVMSQVQNQAYGSQNQTAYQQQLADIAAQKGAQVGADKFNALDMTNQMGLSLGGLSTQQQATDTQGQVGYMGYLGALATADAGKYTADKNFQATQYGTDNGNYVYNNAIKAGLSPEAAAKIANSESTNTKELDNLQYDAYGFPKAATEGAVFTKGGVPYKFIGGKWQYDKNATNPSSTVPATPNNPTPWLPQ
jgi:hypothetical protein